MPKNITQKQLQVATLLHEALEGDRTAGNLLVEGISTSDFPVQLTPALTQYALQGYAEQPTIWRQYAGTSNVSDFGLQEWYGLTGWGDDDVERTTAGTAFIPGGLPRVPEYGEYARLRFEATEKQFRLAKSGVAVQFSWETLVDRRNFGLIPSAFGEFGRRAAETEDQEATKVLTSPVHFSAGNGNLATGVANGPLTIPALEAAFGQIAAQTDQNGNRVLAASRYSLVVPPALELTAEQIKAVTSREIIEGVGTGTETRYVTQGNPVAGKFDVVVNPWLPLVPGGNDTQWFLIPKPGTTPNPTVVNLFLQGYQTPQIFVKRTTNSDPSEGSFENDDYETKVRHVVTGELIVPFGTLKSAG